MRPDKTALTRRRLPPGVHAVNEGLAFVLELLALGALAWWGADAGGGLAPKIVLGAGAPALPGAPGRARPRHRVRRRRRAQPGPGPRRPRRHPPGRRDAGPVTPRAV